MVCQDIADSPDEGFRTEAIIIDFSKTIDLVPHDRLLKKIAATGEDFLRSCKIEGRNINRIAS